MHMLNRQPSSSSGETNARQNQQQRDPDHDSYVRVIPDKNLPSICPCSEGENEVEDERGQEIEAPRPLVCGSCHLTAGIAGVSSLSTGPMIACTQGHLLCQQCVRRYTVCSDVGCVVCGADLATPVPSCYRITNVTSDDNRAHSLVDARNAEAIKAKTLPRVQTIPSVSWNRCQEPSKAPGYNYASIGNNFRNTLGPQYDDHARNPTHGTPSLDSSNEKQFRSYCSIATKRTDEPSSYAPRETNVAQAHSECSRRPIRCPRLDCAVNVAFSALAHHFLFDHPEVPILSVEPGLKSTLIVSLSTLSCESSRCLALLLVSGKLTGAAQRLFNGNQIHPKYQNRLPLPVLAARLHCSNQLLCQDGNRETHTNGDGHKQKDVVITWVAGLDISGTDTNGDLCCSIQVTDGTESGGSRSLTYTGPVNSLRTAQQPHRVFDTGDCVILHQGFIDHVTVGCGNLNVNVIVH